jgi:3',5'-cyclic AMP phosphodiesterase CpdA
MSALHHQHGLPDHTILHLSDTHLVAAGEKLHDVVDPDAHLALMLDGLVRSGTRPEAIVFTGDLTDTGLPDAYGRLRAMVEPAAAAVGAEVIWVMGNHDERAAFRAGLLGEAGTAPVDRVHDVNGLRVVVLDSTVPGQDHGEIDDAQLDWLADVLAAPAPHGTLLALHHPPVPTPLGLLALVELRDQHRLADVVRGTDVRGILGGHLHYSTASTFAGVPVSVASALCYTQDLQVRYPALRGQDGAQAYNLVHVYGDRIVHTVVPIGQFPTVYDRSAEEVAALLAAARDERAAAVAASVAP